MHNHSYENEFNLHVNEISFSYERMSTKTGFEKEAKVIRKWPINMAFADKRSAAEQPRELWKDYKRTSLTIFGEWNFSTQTFRKHKFCDSQQFYKSYPANRLSTGCEKQCKTHFNDFDCSSFQDSPHIYASKNKIPIFVPQFALLIKLP